MCVVTGDGLTPRSPGTKRSIARSDSGASARSTGSLTSVAPARIDAVGAPPNVSRFDDAATIEASLSRSATLAAPISIGAVPNALLSTTRTRLPPMLVRTTWRSVWLLTVAGGTKPRPPPGAAGAGRRLGPRPAGPQAPPQEPGAGAVAPGGRPSGACHPLGPAGDARRGPWPRWPPTCRPSTARSPERRGPA